MGPNRRNPASTDYWPHAKSLKGRRHHLIRRGISIMKWLNHLFGGSNDMAALTAGTKAPDFSLPAMDGSKFSLQEALQHGPVLAAFFKISCPVCQYAFPYFEPPYK